jgi:hypothetical protein
VLVAVVLLLSELAAQEANTSARPASPIKDVRSFL